ncbi:MAG: porin [Burkholderiales bacterium]
MVMLAGSLIIPALAQADNEFVTIYGKMHADFENVSATGATNPANNIPSQNRVSSNSSYIGFKGSEDLGLGLKAIYQIEQGVNVDRGPSSTSGNGFANRNSNVGLSSKTLGTAFYGNWDTPYKVVVRALDPFYSVSIFSAYRAIFGTPGGNVNSSPTGSATSGGTSAAGFGRRENNSIQYWTPNYKGFSARVAYEANEGRSAISATNANTVNPYLWSAAATYESGPYYLSVGYERHRDFLVNSLANTTPVVFPLGLGTPTRSQDTGVKVGAAYSTDITGLGTSRIVAGYERLEYNATGADIGTNVSRFTKNNYFVAVSHKTGGNIFRASYAQASDGGCTFTNGTACNSAGLGAKAFNLGYGYALSKRTEVYAAFVRIINDSRAAYNFGANALGTTITGSQTTGFTPGTGIGAGADPTGYGIGIIHVF